MNLFNIDENLDNIIKLKKKIFNYLNLGAKIKLNILGFKMTFNKTFNYKKADKSILKFNTCGINKNIRNPKIIVSLTSFPKRIQNVYYVIYSLMEQTLKPDKIILYLAEEQFKNKENNLPQNLLNFIQYGLEIKWCSRDIKSYKKLIPILNDYPNDIIITVDDDIFYQKNWLELLYKSYLKNPNCISCHSAHRIKLNSDNDIESYNKWEKRVINYKASYMNFLTGCGGVLYPPHSLYKDVLNEELFMKLAPTADDIWFWAMAVLNMTKIAIVENGIFYPLPIDNNEKGSLYEVNKYQNDIFIQNIINYYPEVVKNLNL